jgi:hypothetical protein
MKHNDLLPILEGVCLASDYGRDSKMKAEELYNKLFPLNHTINDKVAESVLKGIVYHCAGLMKEIECSNVVTVTESLSQKLD